MAVRWPAEAEPSARLLTAVVLGGRWRRSFALPRYTPAGWWECDVFELTRAGYIREYEVKLSRADFFADAGKGKTDWVAGERDAAGVWRPAVRNKHERLAAGDPAGPTRFWFVTPPGLVSPDEVPAFAGLIEAGPAGWAAGWAGEREVKAAPPLHRVKAADAVRMHAARVCYWRMHDLLRAAS